MSTVRDVAVVMQRGEMVHRIAEEIEVLIIEPGVDARLLRLQLDESLYGEIDDQLDLIVADYLPMARDTEDTLAELSRLDDDGLRDLRVVASTLHRGDLSDLDLELAPKGLRVLRRVNRLPEEPVVLDRQPLR